MLQFLNWHGNSFNFLELTIIGLLCCGDGEKLFWKGGEKGFRNLRLLWGEGEMVLQRFSNLGFTIFF